MTEHLLDMHGDHCRFPHWEDRGGTVNASGGRLIPCGKPGYPYCKVHEGLRQARDFMRNHPLRICK